MKKKMAFVVSLVVASALLAACTVDDTLRDAASDVGEEAGQVASEVRETASEVGAEARERAEDALSAVEDGAEELRDDFDGEGYRVLASNMGPESLEKLEGLALDEYPELLMTAEVEEAGTAEPGTAVRVKVQLTNTGDRTVVFNQGSNATRIPDALLIHVEALQPVVPEDYLGITELAGGMLELAPDEEKSYDLTVMTIQPDEEFAEKTNTVFVAENEYIADLEWNILQAMYDDLVKAEPGRYTGETYFTYYTIAADETKDVTRAPTGYASAAFTIEVGPDDGA